MNKVMIRTCQSAKHCEFADSRFVCLPNRLNGEFDEASKELKIEALFKIILAIRSSTAKDWKVPKNCGQDSYVGQPTIMRDIDLMLLKTFGTSLIYDIPEVRAMLEKEDRS